ncbi:MAG: hypothetical protein MJ252_26975, partial [archaeon]|nr:hypothetical protein [archaeon]
MENKISELGKTILNLETVNDNLQKDFEKKQRNLNLETMKNEEKYILKINKLQNDLNKAEKNQTQTLQELENTKKEIQFLKEENLKKEIERRKLNQSNESSIMIDHKIGPSLNDLIGNESQSMSFRINLEDIKDDMNQIEQGRNDLKNLRNNNNVKKILPNSSHFSIEKEMLLNQLKN